jgi:hypothetical protein
MKYPVTRFKDLKVALKEIEALVRDPRHLQTGRPFEKFGGMRPREMLANWLLCATFEAVEGRQLVFYSDPIGGDGLIPEESTEKTWQTEHVYVSRHSGGAGADAHALVLDAINHKRNNGEPYCRGKTLVVFLDAGAGEWFPNRVVRALPDPLYFAAAWVVGLHSVHNGTYAHGVTMLDPTQEDAPAFLLRINGDFDAWEVVQIQ